MSTPRKPPPKSLPIPSSKPQSAIFQHSPSQTSPLHKEWEPGCQPDSIYDATLSPWRAYFRRYLVTRLRKEKDWMADWQGRCRMWCGDWGDWYFYWTAVFGTHMFFMTFLPLFFFFNNPQEGRGLLYVVGQGIYSSCLAKDLVCTPRPYSPPVVRLTMSTHHHEYGFPSSHSTNSVAKALFLAEWLFRSRDQVGLTILTSGWIVLFVYAVSVVLGRLYTGMHSTADVIGGSLMGVCCWANIFMGGNLLEKWFGSGSFMVPMVSIPLTLSLVHYHPETVDDCPCFEDAIAILAVMLGSGLGHWYSARQDVASAWNSRTSMWSEGHVFALGNGAVRIVIGIGIIILWRLAAKWVLFRILPPIFRATSSLFEMELPTRKYYMAATDYSEVPKTPRGRMPSFVDLQNMDQGESTDATPTPDIEIDPPTMQAGPSSSLSVPPMNGHGHALRHRQGKVKGKERENGTETEDKPGVPGADTSPPRARRRRTTDDRAKYDAEVLTKVVVYTGIGLIATTLVPTLFEWVERSIRA